MRFNSNSKNRPKWLFYVAVPVVALGVAGVMLNTNPPTNVAQTAPDAEPALRTRTYSQSVAQVTEIARQIAGEQTTWLRSWRVTQTDENTVHVEVPVIVFTDDLTISVDGEQGKTRVNVKSSSRIGKGDFGENRRHIAQFLRALDERLKKS